VLQLELSQRFPCTYLFSFSERKREKVNEKKRTGGTEGGKYISPVPKEELAKVYPASQMQDVLVASGVPY
jgi:hypothetical protein